MSPSPRLTLAASTTGAVLVALDGTVLTVAQPALQRDLHTDFAQVQWTSTGYLIAVQKARRTLQPLPMLFIASSFGALMLLPLSFALGEQVFPNDWTYVFILALSSQVLGQGLLVYAIGSLPPIVVGRSRPSRNSSRICRC